MEEQSEHGTRHRLPNRRKNETMEIEIENQAYSITLGFYPDGEVGEIFIAGGKVGCQLDGVLADAAILLSRCLIEVPTPRPRGLTARCVKPRATNSAPREGTGEMA